MPWHPVPFRAASVYLRYGFLDLQSADFFRFFIRNLRYSFDLLSGFTRDEYHVIRVDFIVALRRTKGRGRRTLRSPPSPVNHACVVHWTPPHPPGVIRCGGAYLLPRAYRDIGFRYPVQIAYPQFRMLFCFLCSGWYRSRFSRVVGLVSLVFHYWGDRSFVPAATWCFAFSFVGFARNLLRRLTRDWIVCFCG